MIFGIDYLAGAMYPDLILKRHPKGWAAGFFSRTFGDALPVVRKLAISGKCPLIRVHLLWSDTHCFGEVDMPGILRDAKRYERIRGHSRIELSPFCEHNIKLPRGYLDQVASAAPSCTIINTPWKGGTPAPYKFEAHGMVGGRAPTMYASNYSFDGTDAMNSNVIGMLRNFRAADVFFLWTPRLNLLADIHDQTPRPRRRAFPDATTISNLMKLVRTNGNGNHNTGDA